MRAYAARTGFETAVGDARKSHACYVEGCGLFGVADVPVYMVVATVGGEGGLGCGKVVGLEV